MSLSALIKDRGLFGPGLIAFAIKIAGAGLTYGMVVLLARMLGADQYGRFAFGLNAATILAAVGNFGFANALMKFWPKYRVDNNKAAAKGLVQKGLAITALGGLAAAAVVTGLAFVAAWLGFNADPMAFLVIGVLSVIVNLGDTFSNLLRAQGSVVVSMLPRDVLWRIFIPVLGFLALRFGLGLSGTGALCISAGVLLVLVIWQGWVIAGNVAALGPGLVGTFDLAALRPNLIPLWLSSLIYGMIQQFDVVIVGSLLSKADAGAYFAAQKTAQLLSLALIAGGLVTAPSMAGLYHAGKKAELQSLCQKLALAIALSTAAGYLLLVVAGHWLLGLFDPSFRSAYPILLIVGFGAVVDAISGPNAYLMQMTSYEKAYLKIMLGCYIAVVAAQFILIPWLGMIGAALASAGGVILWNLTAIIVLRRHAGLDPSLLALVFPPQPKPKS
ncbi:MAG: oligosaccharide flippase family protein [Alphaproteobacteria bacterium]|nr:oligosaccharide flippase family protein [Alphaproteobacteria bacterium]